MKVKEPDPVGAVIHRLRLEHGITQEALAFRADVTISSLARIERGGVVSPTVRTLRKIAVALDVSMAELVTAVE